MFFFQELCKELHRKIDVVDEARYDLEMKVAKNETEVMVLLCWTTLQKTNERFSSSLLINSNVNKC